MNSWNIYCITKSRLDKVEVEIVEDSRSFTFKLVASFYRNYYIQVTIRSTVKACFALTSEANLLTCFHTSRDFHMYAMSLFLMTCSMTGCTWIFDFFSSTVTDITGYLATHHTKRSLRIDVNDTSAMTASTSDWTCPWLSTRAITCTTASFTMILNFLLSSEDSFFKGQIDTILEIISLARSVWIARRTASAEET
ncbi:Uncharacterised protein [Streptococcus pneumoniae]|nr:Uncharacterised protein [Streptococcus pneumoniae]